MHSTWILRMKHGAARGERFVIAVETEERAAELRKRFTAEELKAISFQIATDPQARGQAPAVVIDEFADLEMLFAERLVNPPVVVSEAAAEEMRRHASDLLEHGPDAANRARDLRRSVLGAPEPIEPVGHTRVVKP